MNEAINSDGDNHSDGADLGTASEPEPEDDLAASEGEAPPGMDTSAFDDLDRSLAAAESEATDRVLYIRRSEAYGDNRVGAAASLGAPVPKPTKAVAEAPGKATALQAGPSLPAPCAIPAQTP